MHKIAGVALQALRVTPKTVWLVLRLTDNQGRTGLGEASLGPDGREVLAIADPLHQGLLGQSLAPGAALIERLPFATLAQAAWSSAVMQAVCDLIAQAADVPMSTLLGGGSGARIPC
ncbi:MAG: hypothetical protein R3E68_06135, partial [Burkholderiaceae bacterium]